MKKILNHNKVILLSLLAISLFFTSCIKNYRDGETNFNGLQPTVSIVEGGLAQFSHQALVYPSSDASDTTIFRVNYAATSVAPANETVTLAIDTTLVAAYNAANNLTGSTAYQVMPDSLFSYSTTQTTVPAGVNYSPAIPFVVYPAKVSDPTISYMLPIKIVTAPSGTTISGNYSIIYYHIIGNPIAGTYDEEWIRWNEADTSGEPDYDLDLGDVTFAPSSPTEIQVGSQGTGETDIIDFTNNAGVLSNFSVSFPDGEAAALGLASMGTPVLQIADPVNGVYRVYFTYVNSAGSPRTIVNVYRRQ